MIDFQRYEKLLNDRLKELDSRLHDIEDELDEPVASDAEERATEREGDEVLEGLGLVGINEIKMINSALERISNGTYGICLSCEEEISKERLESVPHTGLCRKCAK